MFCANPTSRRAMARIRQLKPMHPKEQPFSMICSSISMATEVARVDAYAFRLLNRLCPGHYTVLLPSSKSLPKLLKNKRAVVGVRIPDEPLVLAIVERFKQPLMATSVPSREDGSLLTLGYEVHERHGHGLEMVLDLGAELLGLPTSIIDLTSSEIKVVREGAGDVSFL